MVTEHTTEHTEIMDRIVSHIATRECLLTQPHPPGECGVVAARRRCQEEGDSAMRRQRDEERQPCSGCAAQARFQERVRLSAADASLPQAHLTPAPATRLA